MQIFNGEGALAPPRALRPPLLRDLFEASGKLCVFLEQLVRRLTGSLHLKSYRGAASSLQTYPYSCTLNCAVVVRHLAHLKGAAASVAVAATTSKLFGTAAHALQFGSCRN